MLHSSQQFLIGANHLLKKDQHKTMNNEAVASPHPSPRSGKGQCHWLTTYTWWNPSLTVSKCRNKLCITSQDHFWQPVEYKSVQAWPPHHCHLRLLYEILWSHMKRCALANVEFVPIAFWPLENALKDKVDLFNGMNSPLWLIWQM